MSRNWNLVFYNEGEASFIAMNILCIRIENKDGYIDAYEVVELHDRFMASLSNKERKAYKAEVSRRAKLQENIDKMNKEKCYDVDIISLDALDMYKAKQEGRGYHYDKKTKTIKFDEQFKLKARDTSMTDDGFEYDREDLPSIDDEYYRD